MNLRRTLALSVFAALACLAFDTAAAMPGFVLQDTVLSSAPGEVSSAVRIGSRRHIYEYQATAAGEVTFTLDFDAVQSARRGAEIWVFDSAGQQLSHEVNWPQPSVSTLAALPAAGSFYVFVSHEDYWGFDYDTDYDYTLSHAAATLDGWCVVLQAVLTDFPGWDLYLAKSFLSADLAQAEVFTSEFSDVPSFQLLERNIFAGYCGDLTFDDCDETDPTVVGTDLQCNDFDNTCDMKNFVHQWAGAETDGYSAFQFYRFDGTCQDHSW